MQSHISYQLELIRVCSYEKSLRNKLRYHEFYGPLARWKSSQAFVLGVMFTFFKYCISTVWSYLYGLFLTWFQMCADWSQWVDASVILWFKVRLMSLLIGKSLKCCTRQTGCFCVHMHDSKKRFLSWICRYLNLMDSIFIAWEGATENWMPSVSQVFI